MLYTSTRNGAISISSAQAIKQGLSEEGGLFVPNSFPSVSKEDLDKMVDFSYNERAFFILKKYLTDFTDEELRNCVNQAYTREKFETESIAPLYGIDDKTYFLELWHGPTCAFKDMALQILPHFMTVSAKKTGETKTITILVATSGDTGKAALEGFKDVDGTKIAVFYPENGVSDIQKLQMITQQGGNVYVASVKGNFDDAQNGVKHIFTDDKYKAELAEKNIMLSSANSINFGRLVPQVVYYFNAYCELLKNDKIKSGDPINVVVPTGNFGNILAAYYAKQMGLPIGKLICASNENNVLTDFINTGIYNKKRSFHLTASPSMDILISSNLERFLYEISGKDDRLISELMKQLNEDGVYEISDDMKKKVQENFFGGFCDDAATKETIHSTFERYGYLIDTHTAVAKNVFDQYKEKTGDETVTVIASTASPFKFAPSVLDAVKEEYDREVDEFRLLHELSEASGMKIPKSLEALQESERRFADVFDKNEMRQAVSGFLKI